MNVQQYYAEFSLHHQAGAKMFRSNTAAASVCFNMFQRSRKKKVLKSASWLCYVSHIHLKSPTGHTRLSKAAAAKPLMYWAEQGWAYHLRIQLFVGEWFVSSLKGFIGLILHLYCVTTALLLFGALYIYTVHSARNFRKSKFTTLVQTRPRSWIYNMDNQDDINYKHVLKWPLCYFHFSNMLCYLLDCPNPKWAWHLAFVSLDLNKSQSCS